MVDDDLAAWKEPIMRGRIQEQGARRWGFGLPAAPTGQENCPVAGPGQACQGCLCHLLGALVDVAAKSDAHRGFPALQKRAQLIRRLVLRVIQEEITRDMQVGCFPIRWFGQDCWTVGKEQGVNGRSGLGEKGQ